MLRDPLPLHVGDRVLLRDPGSAALMILGATVLDVDPQALARRGAATAAGRELRQLAGSAVSCDLLRQARLAAGGGAGRDGRSGRHCFGRRGLARRSRPVGRAAPAGWPRWSPRTPSATRWPSACRRRRPAPRSACPTVRWSRRWPTGRSGSRTAICARPVPPADRDPVTGDRAASLPPRIAAAVRAVLADLADAPVPGPQGIRPAAGTGARSAAIAPAAPACCCGWRGAGRAGPRSPSSRPIQILAGLPRPVPPPPRPGQAGTTRRVAIPLLEYLDQFRITQRLPDDRRRLRLTAGPLPEPPSQVLLPAGVQLPNLDGVWPEA